MCPNLLIIIIYTYVYIYIYINIHTSDPATGVDNERDFPIAIALFHEEGVEAVDQLHVVRWILGWS